jgi:hypothetical protein
MNRAKRDIFRFNGDKPTAIDLAHVSYMVLEGKRITFHFNTISLSVDLVNDEEASICFEKLLNVWVADVIDNG